MSLYYAKGTYNVECIECALQESKSGNPMIALKVKVLDSVAKDGSFVPEEKQYDRRIFLAIDPNDDTSIEDVMVRLRQAGWTGDRFENISTEMVGLRFAADCWHSKSKSTDPKYAGQDQENWALWNPVRRESKPLENNPAVAKSLNALFGKRLKEGAKKPDAPPASPPAAPPAPRGDDEGPPDDEVSF